MARDSAAIYNNQILHALAGDDIDRIAPKLERVELPHGKVLYRPEDVIDYVYFPEDSMISVVAYTGDGESSEASVIGREGATGIDVVLGVDTTMNENVTQMPGRAVRMTTADIRAEFARAGKLHNQMLVFTRKLIAQMSQTVLCNRLHSTEKRLSRWLLMCHDRSPTDTLLLTQEFISIMLGASRTTVTLTAITLQEYGFIAYSRGKLTITDRPGLEAFACPCYEAIRSAYAIGPK